jgi:hypothetical protein
MRRAVEEEGDDIPGGDSFMDIVANIVGILVLLVVVVGVRAGRAIIVPETVVAEDIESTEALQKKLGDIVRQAYAEQSEITELADKVVSAVGEVERREMLRESAVLYNTKLRAELDQARSALTTDDQRSLESHNAIAQAQLNLDRLTREQVALSALEPAPDAEIIEVTPAPIVDRYSAANDIVTLRLKDDRIVYLPLREITSDIAGKVKIPAVKSLDQSVKTRERSRTIDGFSGEMLIEWNIRAAGTRAAFYGQPSRLTLQEDIQQRGETLDQAFAPGSYTGSRLELADPSNTIVELYIYGNSFDTAPAACKSLKELGFRVAQVLQTDGSNLSFVSGGQTAVTQ